MGLLVDRNMIRKTISVQKARDLYNRKGLKFGEGSGFERRAKALALQEIAASPGQRVLNVGVGTGNEHAALLAAVGADGRVVGVDIARQMLLETRARTGAVDFVEGDGRFLPFAENAFDSVFCSYVLDLIDYDLIPAWIAAFKRVVKPGGKIVWTTIAPGGGWFSRLIVGAWQGLYRVQPALLGGCRPVRLVSLVQGVGFTAVTHTIVVQWGVPSEVVTAVK